MGLTDEEKRVLRVMGTEVLAPTIEHVYMTRKELRTAPFECSVMCVVLADVLVVAIMPDIRPWVQARGRA